MLRRTKFFCRTDRAAWWAGALHAPVLLLAISIILIAKSAMAVDPLSGLDVRPANTTCVAGDRPIDNQSVKLTPTFGHLASYGPFYLQQSPANASVWYFNTRSGKVYSFVSPGGTPKLVLDVSDIVGALNQNNAYDTGGSEHWGISSFALHPNFANNGYIFLQVNGRKSSETYVTSRVLRYTLVSTGSGFGTTFDRTTQKAIISQQQTNPGVLHHWGHIAFGPDGYLYIGSGDGTNNAPANRSKIPAQNCGDLRGKVLRINVNTTAAYAIPADNPYAQSTTCRREIFATGVRNPWRFSFDSQTGDLWLGDVGKSDWEEVNLIVKGGNYGWPIYEGNACAGTAAQCARTDLIAPVDVTAHAGEAAAAIGGYVYRGTAMPWLQGDYIYSVFPRNALIALKKQANGTYTRRTLLAGAPIFSTYFTDRSGELYGINGHGASPVAQKLVPDVATSSVVIPPTLSATGCFSAGKPLKVVSGAIPYDVISPLWSDAAAKKRWVALPNGATISVKDDGDFDFPKGTVLIKEFSFQGKPFETRLLKRHNDGVWQGYTYAWRNDLSDADLVAADGLTRSVQNTATTTLSWSYPSRAQCLQCHSEAAGYALGPETLQLNGFIGTPYAATGRRGNQLSTWNAIGLFNPPLTKLVTRMPALVDPASTKVSPVLRARSYLHANCAGCHRPDGPTGKAIDLRYQTAIQDMNVCNGDQTAGDVTFPGATILTPQKPTLSALSLRIHALGLGQMPPLGRKVIDTSSAAVIDTWIKRADVCNVIADSDGDGIPNNADNCINQFNPTQVDTDGDRFGNRCDGDFNGSLTTNAVDRADLVSRLGAKFRQGSKWHDRYDLNGDGLINAADRNIFDNELAPANVPGPSALR